MQKEGWVHIMANKRNGTLYRTRHCEVQSTYARVNLAHAVAVPYPSLRGTKYRSNPEN